MSRRIFATAKPSAIGGRVLPMSAVDAEINRRWAPLAKAKLALSKPQPSAAIYKGNSILDKAGSDSHGRGA